MKCHYCTKDATWTFNVPQKDGDITNLFPFAVCDECKAIVKSRFPEVEIFRIPAATKS